MLQTQTVEPGTLSLLKELTEIPELNGFYLVVGTALSLFYGHRISEDLDLFSFRDFENENVISALNREFGKRVVFEEKAA